MSRTKISLAILLLNSFCWLTACSITLGADSDPIEEYQLLVSEKQVTKTKASNTISGTLLIRDVTAAPRIQTRKLLFQEDPFTLSSYTYAKWAERPAEQLTQHLMTSIRDAEIFTHVVGGNTVARAHCQLQISINAFHHDAQTKPGEAVVELSAQLTDLLTRRALAAMEFGRRLRVSSYDAKGAVTALSKASGQLIAEVTEWLAANATQCSTERQRNAASNLEHKEKLA